jgi:putative nucleotidyltransferase with HDIG domain
MNGRRDGPKPEPPPAPRAPRLDVGAWAGRHRTAARCLLLGLVLLSGLTLVPSPQGVRRAGHRLGEVLDRPIIAEFDFPVAKDQEQLLRERQAAAGSVPPVLVRSDSVALSALQTLAQLGDALEGLRRRGPGAATLPGGVALSEPTYALLLTRGTEAALTAARERLRGYFEQGIVSETLERRLAGMERASLRAGGTEWVGPVTRFVGPTRLRRERAEAADATARATAELVEKLAWANVTWDSVATEQSRRLAAEAVEPHLGLILKGEEILGAHKRILPEDLRELESYEKARQLRTGVTLWRERALTFLGHALLLSLALAALVVFLLSYRRESVEDLGDALLLASTLSLALLLGGAMLNLLELPGTLVPIGAFAALLALLYDERVGLAASAFLSLAMALATDASLDLALILGLGSAAAVWSVRRLRDRRQLYRILLYAPLVHLAALGAFGLVRGAPLEALLGDGLYLVANPFLAVTIVLFAVPLSELWFGKCTSLTLLELLDLNRPLLRRLMLEAPGTYHHSLMVGTLAEVGAARIGADPLLARVIGYHHDIGKLKKPEYFIENQPVGRRNPHDRLMPGLSRLILESHVRDGVALGRASRLPRAVLEGIAQHHATGRMDYFYQRARQRDRDTPETEYRYPGPRPRSREAAIVLLADQIDATSRSLEDPTPSRLRGVVTQLIEKRAADGELDDSRLMLRDLAELREAFVPILTALFHGRRTGRPGYPDPEHLHGKPPAGPPAEPAAPPAD